MEAQIANDQDTAIAALLKQVQTLTEKLETLEPRIESTFKRNDKLLDENKDLKRAAAKSGIDLAFERHEQRNAEQASGLVTDASGRTRLGNTDGAFVITREDARDPARYRELKAAADEAGVEMRVASDG